MATSLELCNAALMRLGAEPMNAFSDNTKRAKLCNAHYDRLKRDLISASPWNFSLKRTRIAAESVTFAPGDVNTGTDEITLTAHGKKTGQRINMKAASGGSIPVPLLAGQEYFLIVVDANTVKMAESFADANAGTAIGLTAVSVDTTTLFYAPLFGFTNQFAIPKDYMRMFRIEPDTVELQFEGASIYADEEELLLLYQANAKEKLFPAYFEQALILHLATSLSYTLIQSNETSLKLKDEFEASLKDARLYDAQEGTPYPLTADEWVQSRF